MAQQFGWLEDADGVDEVIHDPTTSVVEMNNAQFQELKSWTTPTTSKPPVVLFDALQALQPDWFRGSQGIGDCVSWAYELGCTLAAAVDIFVKREPWQWSGPFATEPIYGGARVEALDKKTASWSDGAYGAAAAKFVTRFGALHRIDYSLATGLADQDLRTYDADKAKRWGFYGCGGKHDGGQLDNVAKSQPVRNAYRVKTFEEAKAAIESGFPVAVCSDQGFGPRKADGFAGTIRKPWHHAMLFGGVRYDHDGLLVSNSWGNSWGTKAPLPGVEWDAVKKCSAWVDDRVVDNMLSRGDSFVLTGVDGLRRRRIDWSGGWEIEGR